MFSDKANRYFHVTQKQALESILANGLIPQIGARSREIGESHDAVYLFPDSDALIDGITNWFNDCFDDTDELVVLQIDLPEWFPIHKKAETCGNDFYEVRCTRHIPPKYITAIFDEDIM